MPRRGREGCGRTPLDHDAIYRELVPKIEEYGHDGVLGVDMETSAMYALGQFRDMEVCNLLIVSDELWKDWNPAFGSDELREAGKLGMRIIRRSLEQGIAPDQARK